MSKAAGMDVRAVLAAAYGRPDAALDQVAGRVRARLALMETMTECARMLLEVPSSAIVASIGSTSVAKQEQNDE